MDLDVADISGRQEEDGFGNAVADEPEHPALLDTRNVRKRRFIIRIETGISAEVAVGLRSGTGLEAVILIRVATDAQDDASVGWRRLDGAEAQ
ncbi:MAG: hypothetical protein ACK5WM_06155, partial [Rhodospirillales bacterium]